MATEAISDIRLRDFDSPDLSIAELCRPVSASEISARAYTSAIEQRAGRGGGYVKSALGSARNSKSADLIVRSQTNKLAAEKKFREREERKRKRRERHAQQV